MAEDETVEDEAEGGNTNEPQAETDLPATVDQGLAEASGPMIRVSLTKIQQARVAEAQVVQLETASRQAGDDRSLRKWIAGIAGGAVFVQVAVADAVFVIYADQHSWNIPPSTIHAWLGATVVQVVAVALVVARSLFPQRGKEAAQDDQK